MIILKYYLCQYENKISEHTSEHALNLALEKTKLALEKTKRENVYKIIIPDLEIGLKIYSKRGYYGEIAIITETCIHIKRPKDKEPLDYMYMLKERFETFFINKTFTIDLIEK